LKMDYHWLARKHISRKVWITWVCQSQWRNSWIRRTKNEMVPLILQLLVIVSINIFESLSTIRWNRPYLSKLYQASDKVPASQYVERFNLANKSFSSNVASYEEATIACKAPHFFTCSIIIKFHSTITWSILANIHNSLVLWVDLQNR
jgi:hypothetical protein